MTAALLWALLHTTGAAPCVLRVSCAADGQCTGAVVGQCRAELEPCLTGWVELAGRRLDVLGCANAPFPRAVDFER